MKFTPDHRPISLTGITAVAGVATLGLLFFLTSSSLPVSAPSHPVTTAPAPRDTVKVEPVVPPAVDQASADAPASILRVPGLTESVRASLLAVADVLHERRSPTPAHAGAAPGHPAGDRAEQGGRAGVHPGAVRKSEGSVTFGSLQWIGGGKRKKAAGALPGWPAGVTGEVHCKVEAVVAPDGHVKSVRPGQKGNAKCEDAAVRAVQRWRFERLSRHIPQRDQRCVMTFTFTAK